MRTSDGPKWTAESGGRIEVRMVWGIRERNRFSLDGPKWTAQSVGGGGGVRMG